MIVIDLRETPIDDLPGTGRRRWYYGCGRGVLAVNATGQPVALRYDEPPAPDAPQPTDQQLVDMAGDGGRVLRGMCSCWEFVAQLDATRYWVRDDRTGELFGPYTSEAVAFASCNRVARDTGHDASTWIGTDDGPVRDHGFYL